MRVDLCARGRYLFRMEKVMRKLSSPLRFARLTCGGVLERLLCSISLCAALMLSDPA